VPSCVPSDPTSGNLGSLWSSWTGQRAYYEPTIFDRLDGAGISWKIYGGAYNGSGGAGYGWTICPTFEECIGGPQRSNFVSSINLPTGVFAGGPLANDIANGTLPAVSFVTPTQTYSAHQPQAMSVADNWIGTIVGAIQTNPDLWSSTAVFVTFDDCGCFYDPVNPLQYDPEWGPRVPMLIISPYAKAGYTDSTPATFASLLAYVEQTFNVPALNPCATVDSWDPNCSDDVRAPSSVNGGVAYAFQNAFDYGQTPLGPTVIVHTPLTPSQRAFLRNHPNAGDEAT
jgi:phospholipase C